MTTRTPFEAWGYDNGHDMSKREDGDYADRATYAADEAWEAATAAQIEKDAELCIEERVDAEGSGDATDYSYNAAIEHCVAAIRAQGK